MKTDAQAKPILVAIDTTLPRRHGLSCDVKPSGENFHSAICESWNSKHAEHPTFTWQSLMSVERAFCLPQRRTCTERCLASHSRPDSGPKWISSGRPSDHLEWEAT